MNSEDVLLFLSAVLKLSRGQVQRLKKLTPSLSGRLPFSEAGIKISGAEPELLRALSDSAAAEALVSKERKRLEERGIRFLTPPDPEWPLRFGRMPDPPLWIFVRGSLPPADLPTVSVIGSRAASPYGMQMAELISGELAASGVGIVSGMAAGIDAASQRAALRRGGKSFALLGSGLNICYPRENFELFEALAQTEGCGVISEFPLDSPSIAWHFPDRNRLIAALGDCLALIEAGSRRSGSMITVGEALEQGKEVFAMPGRITDPMSCGCNELIKMGAAPLTGADDILELIGPVRSRRLSPAKKRLEGLSETESSVYALLSEEPRFLDEIIRETGLSTGDAMSILLKLERLGAAQQSGGGGYCAVLE